MQPGLSSVEIGLEMQENYEMYLNIFPLTILLKVDI